MVSPRSLQGPRTRSITTILPATPHHFTPNLVDVSLLLRSYSLFLHLFNWMLKEIHRWFYLVFLLSNVSRPTKSHHQSWTSLLQPEKTLPNLHQGFLGINSETKALLLHPPCSLKPTPAYYRWKFPCNPELLLREEMTTSLCPTSKGSLTNKTTKWSISPFSLTYIFVPIPY